ncbi:MAG TPA: hypothetical protein PLH84_05915 [Candidatus Krumholzibacteria bacterium]|nr:hypothetical protein [Candidatus Krumholzibacteria bacterium]
MVLVALCLLTLPAQSAPLQVSQSISVYRDGGSGVVPGESTVGYTALGASGLHWRWRGALSWWRWQPDSGTGLISDSGVGALNVTVGRSLWDSYGAKGASRGWAQIKGAIPLGDSPTPVNSGRFDWGASLLATNRYREFLVFVELGFLSPGDPVGVDYNSQLSGAISVSWHHHGLPFYPVASFVAASPIVDGIPDYGEWSAGLGASLSRRAGLLALYSHGTNTGSPGRGLTAVLTFRL